jgi:hypothetical protein
VFFKGSIPYTYVHKDNWNKIPIEQLDL